MDLLNFFLIFTKLCILLENKEKKFGVRGTLRYIEKWRIIVYRKLYWTDFRETFLFKVPS